MNRALIAAYLMSEAKKKARAKHISLFDRLGGTPVIKSIVEEFYRRVTSDLYLSRIFADVDLKWLKEKQTENFVQATGGPMTQQVIRLKSKYIHLPTNESYFSTMRRHLIDTLMHLSIDFSLIDEVVELLRPIVYSENQGDGREVT